MKKKLYQHAVTAHMMPLHIRGGGITDYQPVHPGRMVHKHAAPCRDDRQQHHLPAVSQLGEVGRFTLLDSLSTHLHGEGMKGIVIIRTSRLRGVLTSARTVMSR